MHGVSSDFITCKRIIGNWLNNFVLRAAERYLITSYQSPVTRIKFCALFVQHDTRKRVSGYDYPVKDKSLDSGYFGHPRVFTNLFLDEI
ncbi:MAG: hypothetical protein AB1414_13240 [bacterium]